MKVFDLHCDTLSELRYAEEAGQPKSFAENDLQIDLKKLQKGDYMLQCFAAFVNLARPGQDPLVAALEEIDIFKRIMAKYSDFIAPVYQPEDLRKNAEAGKISGMLTIEEGGCCKGSLGVLRLMHDLEPRKRAGQPQCGAGSRHGYHLALPTQYEDRPERKGLRVPGRDGAAAHHCRREPPLG